MAGRSAFAASLLCSLRVDFPIFVGISDEICLSLMDAAAHDELAQAFDAAAAMVSGFPPKSAMLLVKRRLKQLGCELAELDQQEELERSEKKHQEELERSEKKYQEELERSKKKHQEELERRRKLFEEEEEVRRIHVRSWLAISNEHAEMMLASIDPAERGFYALAMKELQKKERIDRSLSSSFKGLATRSFSTLSTAVNAMILRNELQTNVASILVGPTVEFVGRFDGRPGPSGDENEKYHPHLKWQVSCLLNDEEMSRIHFVHTFETSMAGFDGVMPDFVVSSTPEPTNVQDVRLVVECKVKGGGNFAHRLADVGSLLKYLEPILVSPPGLRPFVYGVLTDCYYVVVVRAWIEEQSLHAEMSPTMSLESAEGKRALKRMLLASDEDLGYPGRIMSSTGVIRVGEVFQHRQLGSIVGSVRDSNMVFKKVRCLFIGGDMCVWDWGGLICTTDA